MVFVFGFFCNFFRALFRKSHRGAYRLKPALVLKNIRAKLRADMLNGFSVLHPPLHHSKTNIIESAPLNHWRKSQHLF